MPDQMDGEKLKTGTLRLTSYEIGVLYCAMQEVGRATGDARYADFAAKRLNLIAKAEPTSLKRLKVNSKFDDQMRQIRLFREKMWVPEKYVRDPHLLHAL